jgi:hypothetical protein
VQIEAGHAAQNIFLQAVALGLGTVIIGAFDDEAVNAALGMPVDEEPLYMMPVGRIMRFVDIWREGAMTVSTMELAKGRDTVATLLEELGVDAYLFGVEPRTATIWDVQLECAIESGWTRVVVPVARDQLLRCLDHEQAHQEVLEQLRAHLEACTLRKGD